jgi:hypothetical protein
MKRKSALLVLLTLIFALPLLAAWLSYSRGMLLTGRHVNHGVLLTHPVSLSSLNLANETGGPVRELRGKWWLFYITDDPASSIAQHHLYYIRQIRQATGKDRERIERGVVVVQSNLGKKRWLDEHYPGSYLFTVRENALAQLRAQLPKKLALKEGSLYLVDPLGNIIMYYAPDAAPKGILKDLVRVLKVSQIG